MIHKSTYTATEQARLLNPLESFFEVDERIARESSRLAAGAPGLRAGHSGWVQGALRLLTDAAVLAFSASIGPGLLAQGAGHPTWSAVLATTWLGMLMVGRCYPGWGNGPVDRLKANVRAAFSATLLAILVAFLGGYLTRHELAVIAAVSVLASGALIICRHLLKRAAVRMGFWGVATVFYGTTDSARRIIQVLQMQPSVGFKPVGIFEDDPRMWGRDLAGVPVLGDTSLVHPDASVAVVAGISGEEAHRKMDTLVRYYRKVVLVPDLLEQSISVLQPVDFGGLMGLQVRVNLTSKWYRGLKRGLELALVLMTLPLWGTVVAVSAILVWAEDQASPFYSQARIGRLGKTIYVRKLRTMVPNAEAVLQRAIEADASLRIEWEATSKLQKDPRITRVGSVLRRLSIDELPQLINVIRGEMALIGPRPLPEYHESRLGPEVRDLRRRVRPGVTGLWQISGRSDTGDAGIAWLDSYYVRNWSFWLDVAILMKTAGAALRGQGAY